MKLPIFATQGQTALDCLVEFRQRSDLGRQDISDIKAVERLLRATMGGEWTGVNSLIPMKHVSDFKKFTFQKKNVRNVFQLILITSYEMPILVTFFFAHNSYSMENSCCYN